MPVLLGPTFVVVATGLARAYRPELSLNLLALGLWAAGLAAVLLRWSSPSDLVTAMSRVLQKRRLVVHCAVLFGLALLLRVVWLDTLPANLNGDAYSQALDAVAFIEGRLVNVFGTSDWYGVPLLYPWIGSWFIRAFGTEPWVWRLYTALAGAATVPLVYLLVRVQFGRARLALLAGLLLTFYHVHVYFSRIGSNQGFDALFTATLLLALVLAHRLPRSGLWWYVAGVVAGLGCYFYFALRGVAVIGLAIVVVFTVMREAPRLRAPFWYLAGLALAVAPLVAKPAGFGLGHTVRLRQVLQAPVSSDGSSLFVLAQRGAVALQSVYGTTLRGWYHSDAGVLVSPIELLLLIVGLAVALRLRRQAGWTHPAVLFGVLAVAALLIENPIMAQRVTSVSVPVCVILALGIDRVSRLGPRRTWGIVAALLVFAVVGWNFHHLFATHMPRRNTDATSFVATELARRLAAEPGLKRVVVCGGDVMHWDSHSALPYQIPGLRGRDIGADATIPARPEEATVYAVLPMCNSLADRLEGHPALRGEALRYRAAERGDVLRMYAETRGRGFLRWLPTEGAQPLAPDEEIVMTIFLARDLAVD